MKPSLRLGLVFLVGTTRSACSAEPEVLTVEEYLGKGGSYSYRDGPGTEARFRWPTGIAVDSAGRAYVADQSPTIRRIDLDGTVTTIAGVDGRFGLRNGPAAQSLFSSPRALVFDSEGNLFVADESNHTIRKISAGGEVTTLAGFANSAGSVNGMGAGAMFNTPRGIAINRSGNLYVADQGNRQIRRITPAGMVTLFTDNAGQTPEGLEFDLGGALIVADWGGGSGGGLNQVSSSGVKSSLPVNAQPRFSDPTDVARDAAGNLFVSDTRNECIRAVLTNRTVTVFAGSIRTPGGEDGPAENARFRGPRGVAVGPDGALWVADTENNAVRKLNPDGSTITVAGLPAGSRDGIGVAARLTQPEGMAFAPDGSLWLTDTGNSTIRRVDSNRQVTTVAGSAGASDITDGPDTDARFRGPMGVAVAQDNTVYVADAYSSCIRRRTPDGMVSTFAGKPLSSGRVDGRGEAARFSSPHGLALDRDGNLLVADAFNAAIRKISPDGEVTTFAGALGQPGTADGTRTNARFREPRNLVVAPDGAVFVSDTGASTIRRIDADGTVTTFAGLRDSSGYSDGIGNKAKFLNPWGLALDSHGYLWVADRGNRCIRRISPNGAVTTVAGKPGPIGSVVGSGADARFFSPSALVIDTEDRVFIADSGDNVVRLGTLAAEAPLPPKVTLLESSVRLSWPSSATGVVLEQRAALSSDSIWASVQVAPTVENGEAVIVIPTGTDTQFFRLVLP